MKMQHPLLVLFEHIHRPFVLRLIALLVSALIALLLGGALLLAGHCTFVSHVAQWPLSTIMCIAASNTSVW
jgi:hypothetical protein